MKRIPIEHPARLGGGVKREQVLLLKHINAAVAAGNTARAESLRARLRELDASNADRRKRRLVTEPRPVTEKQCQRLESRRQNKQTTENKRRIDRLTKKDGTCL